MKAFKKLIFMLMACLFIPLAIKDTAFASTGTISLSDPTAAVGEDVSVTVKTTTSDNSKIASVAMELTYDPSVLEFKEGTSATNDNGSVKISSTADSSIKTYTLTFKALKSGAASIKINSYDIKDSKSATIEMSKVGSSSVTITGEGSADTTAQTDTNTQTEATDSTEEADATGATDTTEETMGGETQEADDPTAVANVEDKIVTPPNKDVKVQIAGSDFYICKITKDIIPEGFEHIGYQYGAVAVDAVRKDNMVLFYLNKIGEAPYIFYLYDDITGGFYKYAPVMQTLGYSVIQADDSVVIPSGYSAADVSVGGVAVSGWQSTSNSEFYLLYIMNTDGEKGLYSYDAVEKTVQRYDSSATSSTETQTDSTDDFQKMYTELTTQYNHDMQSKTYTIYGLIVLAVVLAFVIINLLFRLSDKHHAHLEDEEDSDFDEYEDLDEEDDYEENEDDDDYEEEFIDSKSEKQLKREMKKAEKLEKKKAKKEKAAKSKSYYTKEEAEELEIDEEDYDDSDDFKVEIFDFDEKKK